MKITYDAIANLVHHAEARDGMMYCEFKDPRHERVVRSQARIERINTKQKQMQHIVHTNAFYFVRSQIINAIYNILGNNLFGHTIRQLAWTSMPGSPAPNPDNGDYTQHEKEEAITEAFRKIAPQFDSYDGKWSMKQESTPFESIIKNSPIETRYDRTILARMLVELASIDGNINNDERDFLRNFIPPDAGSIDDIMRKERLSAVELDETSPKAREALYLMAWTVTLTDKTLSSREKERLRDYAVMLSIPNRRADEITLIAKQHIIETVVATEATSQYVSNVADAIELSKDEAMRAIVRYQKRTY